MNDRVKSLNVVQYVTESLIKLGIKANLRGFCYIKEAIIIYPEVIYHNKTIKDIYAEIAETYNTNVISVERAIRTAIESAWYSNNINLSHDLFNFPYIIAERNPTNSELIAAMSEIIFMKTKPCCHN
jgi:two-component system response regulator (stage 0 sporulation protein A)